jgi:hypothetical protein
MHYGVRALKGFCIRTRGLACTAPDECLHDACIDKMSWHEITRQNARETRACAILFDVAPNWMTKRGDQVMVSPAEAPGCVAL